MTPWSWWAGEIDADSYALAEAATREAVIQQASSGMKPGDQFCIIKARSSEDRRYEGADMVPFLRTRNHEIITVGPIAAPEGEP